MHVTGTKHIVHHRQKSVLQWSVISKFTCITYTNDDSDNIENARDSGMIMMIMMIMMMIIMILIMMMVMMIKIMIKK